MAARNHLLRRSQLIEREHFIQHLSTLWPTVNIDSIATLFDTFDVDGDGQLNDVEMKQFDDVIVNPLVQSIKIALIVVDFQNDFIDGSLRIVDGNAHQQPIDALPIINQLIDAADRYNITIVYTYDWHPYNHISFVEHCYDTDRRLLYERDRLRSTPLHAFDSVQFEVPKCQQTLYTRHCVQDTWGAKLHSDLVIKSDAIVIRKGLNTYVDSYSAFADNQQIEHTQLESSLRNANINVCFVCGLAYDVCVSATARDAIKLGFLSAIITDASKGIDTVTIDETNRQLIEQNGAIIDSCEALAIATGDYIPWNWILALVSLTTK